MRYQVKAAAIATGVSESTLRTWERRYGIPRPTRSPTGRRSYDEADLAVVRRMAALVAAGSPASQAAQDALSERALAGLPRDAPQGAHPTVERLRRAVHAFEAATFARELSAAGREHGWGVTLDAVVTPLLQALAHEWSQGELSPAHTRFAAAQTRSAIAGAIALQPEPVADAPQVLLACPQDERDELALLGLALLLAGEGLHVISLGGDVPLDDLLSAAERITPGAVCLAASTPSAVIPLALAARALAERELTTHLFIGGPALASNHAIDWAPGVRLPSALTASAEAITRTLGWVNGRGGS